jgi:hypothetical protein
MAVALLINWAGAQGGAGHLAAALRTLEVAAARAEALPHTYPLRQVRLHTIEFNRVLLTTSGEETLTRLGAIVDEFEADAAVELAARVHLELGVTLGRGDLYTAALHHVSHAIRLYADADRPPGAARAQIALAGLLDNLGLFDKARQIIADVRPLMDGSAMRAAEALRQIRIATDLERLAENEDAFAALDLAYRLLEPVMEQAPGLVVNEIPASDVITGGLLLARKCDDAAALAKWTARADRYAQLVGALEFGELHALNMQFAVAWMCEDWTHLESLASSLAEAAARSPLPGAAEKAAALSTVGRTGEHLLSAYFGRDPTPLTDVSEYWDHIRQLTSEDDEAVRAAYRRANLLPVLHRMLNRSQISAFGQFEAVELSRWGSLTGGLGVVSSEDSDQRFDERLFVGNREAMRGRFLQRAAGGGARYPASLGAARSIAWGPWKGGIVDDRSALPWCPPPVDLRALLAAGDWPDEPECFQLYVRGSRVHWARLNSLDASAERGDFPLSSADAKALSHLATWLSPEPNALDHQLVADLGLEPAALSATSAVRCCLGPFVNDRELARDFALEIPVAARTRLVTLVDEQLARCPSASALGSALGRLFLPALWIPSDRPLVLSVPWELSRLPLMLALSPSGMELAEARMISLLPPVDTLSNMPRQMSNSSVPEWSLSTTGASRADLLWGDLLAAAPLRDAFMRASDGKAHAVLYKGHYSATSGPPSMATIGKEETDQLLAAAEILTSDCAAPARVALMCCRDAGLHFADEWGGIASALMIKGAREVVAPSWPIIDSANATIVDDVLANVLSVAGHLNAHLAGLFRGLIDDWKRDVPNRVSPHWWSGYYLLKG